MWGRGSSHRWQSDGRGSSGGKRWESLGDKVVTRVWVKAVEGLQQKIRDVRGGSRMLGDVRRSSEKFLWMVRAELWMARAAVVEACPARTMSSQFIWLSTPTVRQHAATSRRCVLMMPRRALANDGLKCFWCVCLVLCVFIFCVVVQGEKSRSSIVNKVFSADSLCDPVWLSATALCILELEKVASAQISVP